MTLPWQPSASLENLYLRAKVLNDIRKFFFDKGVTEVETPLMCSSSVTDPFIESVDAFFQSGPNQKKQCYYLQTSPEFAMKRLLAAGIGPIFQICKAFRQGEIGRFHNPEFTMLEWYQPGYNHHDLMNEIDELLQFILNALPAERKTYEELFMQNLRINPRQATINELADCAQENNIIVNTDITDRDTWLTILMTHAIEPKLGIEQPTFVYNYPSTQSSLARVEGNPPTASRFEVFIQGIELANGFHELQDPVEQRHRFEKNLAERKRLGLPIMPIDEYFLDALEHGLPNCAGVALGIDRLMMIAAKSEKISEVVSFDFLHV